jgi:hypothetical protein
MGCRRKSLALNAELGHRRCRQAKRISQSQRSISPGLSDLFPVPAVQRWSIKPLEKVKHGLVWVGIPAKGQRRRTEHLGDSFRKEARPRIPQVVANFWQLRGRGNQKAVPPRQLRNGEHFFWAPQACSLESLVEAPYANPGLTGNVRNAVIPVWSFKKLDQSSLQIKGQVAYSSFHSPKQPVSKTTPSR